MVRVRETVLFLLVTVGFMPIPRVGLAQTLGEMPPVISIESLTEELPQPFFDFIQSTQQLSDNIFSSVTRTNFSVNIPITQEWFSSPENFWNRLEAWIHGYTGVSLNAVWGFVSGFVKLLFKIFVWLLNFILGVVEYLIGLIS